MFICGLTGKVLLEITRHDGRYHGEVLEGIVIMSMAWYRAFLNLNSQIVFGDR